MAVPSGRYRFTGREFESITGFQYHRARYYDPGTGRWTSQDPLGLLIDTNPYRYAANSPTNFIDPDGQLFLPIPLLFGAAVLAVLLQPQIANAPSQTDVPTGRNDFGLALLGSVEATALLAPASIGLRGTAAAVASAPTRRLALLALSERVIGGGAGAVEGVLQAQAAGGSAADQLIAGVLGFGFGLISPRAAFSSFATASAAGAVGGIIGGRPGARVGFQVGGLIGAFGHTLTSAAVAARGQGATRALLTGLRGVAPEAASAGLGAVVFPELLGVDPLTGAELGLFGGAVLRGAGGFSIQAFRKARTALRRMPRGMAIELPDGHIISRQGTLYCRIGSFDCNDAAEYIRKLEKDFSERFEREIHADFLEQIGASEITLGKSAVRIGNPWGPLGKPSTREHVALVSQELVRRGWTITAGGGEFSKAKRLPEEHLPLPGGGFAKPDITAKRGARILRINTVTTLADGKTPTRDEFIRAARLRTGLKPGEHLLLIPKPKT